MINVSELINDPDFVSNFSIERKSGGKWENGEYSENTTMLNDLQGTIQPYKPKTEEYDASGNIISGDITVNTLFQIFTTRDEDDNKNTATSDIIIWKNERYKVKNVKNWSDNGYYKAVAERISPC